MRNLKFLALIVSVMSTYFLSSRVHASVTKKEGFKNCFTLTYVLASAEEIVLEVKNNQLPDHFPKSWIYQWIYFHMPSQYYHTLTFQSMSSKEGNEYRTFAEAQLEFNQLFGWFSFTGDSSRKFKNISGSQDQIPSDVFNAIDDFLSEQYYSK